MEIKEELQLKLDNNTKLQEDLLKKVDLLPKGHINTLYRNNKGYYYLTYRDGNKVKNDYLGPAGNCDLNKIFEGLKLRKQYILELKELKNEEKILIKQIKKTK